MKQLLVGQKALVTGATRGIGKAIAWKFAEQGARLFLFGTDKVRGKNCVKEIQNEFSVKADFFAVDVSDTIAVENILKEFPPLDIVINNAGIVHDQLFLKMTETDWDRIMDVNLKSCYNVLKPLIRQMMKVRRGKIVNMSSIIGLRGNVGQANYAASKAAIIGLTRALATELGSRNICVNCIAPGYIETQMTDSMQPEKQKEILGKIPLGRMGNVEDIANAALFLSSSLSDYITGQVLVVDGGLAHSI